MNTDLPRLLQAWKKAGRLDWLVTLAMVGLTLPTALTLYGELATTKTERGWVEFAVLGSIVPLVAIMLFRHWLQHRISRQIVDALLTNGWAPTGLFDQLKEEDKRLIQHNVLASIPLHPGEGIAVSEIVANEPTADRKAIVHFQATVILDFFQSLGLLEKQAKNRIVAVSEHASALLHCVALGVREHVPLLTNWKVKDVADPAFQRAFSFISAAEDNRRDVSRPASWAPVRQNIAASVTIIKGVRHGVEEVLVRWSGAWNTFNWVGGTQEARDTDAEACAWREIHEELGLDRLGALSLHRIGSVISKPIKSKRLGVYSTWNYTVFGLNAQSIAKNSLPEALRRIIPPVAEFEVFTDELRLTKTRWMTWADIESQGDFAGYGPELAQFLTNHFGGISPSFSFDLGS
jgi:8-oxo-dGTP pyrophosphatase MutT (NUDIX family)